MDPCTVQKLPAYLFTFGNRSYLSKHTLPLTPTEAGTLFDYTRQQVLPQRAHPAADSH